MLAAQEGLRSTDLVLSHVLSGVVENVGKEWAGFMILISNFRSISSKMLQSVH